MAVFSQEASRGSNLSNKKKLALGLAGVTMAFAGGGAGVGYFVISGDNSGKKATDISTANQYRRCATFAQGYLNTNGNNVAKLSMLTARQQADCGYSFSDETEAAKQAAQTEVLPGSAVVNVNTNNTTVRLPNPTLLQHQATSLIADSHELSQGANEVSGAVSGAGVGLAVEFIFADLVLLGAIVDEGDFGALKRGVEWVKAN
jgi:hypothetical protein